MVGDDEHGVMLGEDVQHVTVSKVGELAVSVSETAGQKVTGPSQGARGCEGPGGVGEHTKDKVAKAKAKVGTKDKAVKRSKGSVAGGDPVGDKTEKRTKGSATGGDAGVTGGRVGFPVGASSAEGAKKREHLKKRHGAGQEQRRGRSRPADQAERAWLERQRAMGRSAAEAKAKWAQGRRVWLKCQRWKLRRRARPGMACARIENGRSLEEPRQCEAVEEEPNDQQDEESAKLQPVEAEPEGAKMQ